MIRCKGFGPTTRPGYLRDNEPDLACPNEARYITEEGSWLCGVCDASQDSIASIRLSDVPMLIKLLGDIAIRRLAPSDIVGGGGAFLDRADLADMIALISKRGVTFQ